MKDKRKSTGFSLTEVLMAVGILGVGMLFVAGTFPVAIHFNMVATERTTAALAADEAFAKIRLYDVPDFTTPPWPANPWIECVDFNDVWNRAFPPLWINPDEFAYPSTAPALMAKQYYWSALCRRVGVNNVQVTVFVSRRTGLGRIYRDSDDPFNSFVYYPMPIKVAVSAIGNADELSIDDVDPGVDEATFINAGCTIVDNKTGRLYRVLQRYEPPEDSVILLDRPWWDSDGSGVDAVWVVPSGVTGGRYPCVAVYQKVIRF